MTDLKQSFTCKKCGQTHEMNLCFGSEFPDFYFTIPSEERTNRVEINNDLCVIDEQHFFIRGRISIPIKNTDEELEFNVWTTISKENFIRTNTLWDDPSRIYEPPYFGWLQTQIPGYKDTLNIQTLIHTNEVGIIPTIEIIQKDHVLYTDQTEGLTIDEVESVIQTIIH